MPDRLPIISLRGLSSIHDPRIIEPGVHTSFTTPLAELSFAAFTTDADARRRTRDVAPNCAACAQPHRARRLVRGRFARLRRARRAGRQGPAARLLRCRPGGLRGHACARSTAAAKCGTPNCAAIPPPTRTRCRASSTACAASTRRSERMQRAPRIRARRARAASAASARGWRTIRPPRLVAHPRPDAPRRRARSQRRRRARRRGAQRPLHGVGKLRRGADVVGTFDGGLFVGLLLRGHGATFEGERFTGGSTLDGRGYHAGG